MSLTFRKIVAASLSTNFREACKIVHSEVGNLGDLEVLVKNRFVGINATDVNVAAGRYSPSRKPPLETGLEGVGTIVEVGKDVPSELKGKAVGYIYNGAFSEYITLPAKVALPLPAEKPAYVPLLISGLTAAIAFDKLGELKPKETVLITAAAGGTGHLAVQLAKLAGCHVIALCSSKEKVDFLQNLGCDRVINYKEEDFGKALRDEYPRGIDVVYESIGGNVFETCLNRLAIGGRIISLGFISSYHSPGGVDRNVKHATIIQKLLLKSASVRGFFLMNHAKHYGEYLPKLIDLVQKDQLKPHIEVIPCTQSSDGLQSVFDAVDYLYSRSSIGKIVVDLKMIPGSNL
ncbi:prostaglandin reductase-3-like [Rhopilema esculentum]|uniref:prostaglandin reductase-3-like n=1 Tax=Rhopilema esculentum TaxID=499914 RepID=UPI0031DD6FC4|eukprot:gene10880-19703_t